MDIYKVMSHYTNPVTRVGGGNIEGVYMQKQELINALDANLCGEICDSTEQGVSFGAEHMGGDIPSI